MKKKKLILLSALAAASITTVAVTSSCKKDKDVDSTTTEQETETKTPATLKSISASGYSKVVLLGSNVEDIYKDAKVVATYSDGSTKDITDSVKWNTSNVVVDKDGKITKTGKYSITVKSGSYTDSFIVTVSDYSLESIEVDTTKADLSYTPYSSVNDFSSVVVYANYKNPVDGTINKVAVDSDLVSFVVTDKDNKVVDQVIAEGNYTVTVSALDKTATFTITCGPIETATTVADAVAQASKGEITINNGTYTYYDGREEYTTKKVYTLGQHYSKVEEEANYGNSTSYFSVASDGSAFAAQVDEDGNVSKYYSDHLANVKDAYALGFDIFSSGDTVYPQYGFGEVVSALYEQYLNTYSDESNVTKHESVGVCAHIKDSEGKAVSGYNFDFNMIENASGAAHFYHYSVEFTLNDSGAVEEAYVSIDTYEYTDPEDYWAYIEYDDIKQAGYTLPSSFGLTLVKGSDEAGADLYSFTISDTANVTYTSTHSVKQSSGVKANDSTNPYCEDKVKVSSFKVVKYNSDNTTEELVDGSTYNIDLDDATYEQDDKSHRFEFNIKFEDILPQTASTSLDNIKVVIKGTGYDGAEVDSSNWSGGNTSYATVRSWYDDNYDEQGKVIQISRPGTYTVTVSSLNVTKTYTYVVSAEAPQVITTKVSDGEANSDFSTVSSISCYTSNTIYLDAEIAKYYTQGYSVKAQKYDADHNLVDTTDVTLTKGTYTVNGKEVECYSFNASVAGSYLVTFTGATPDSGTRSAATASVEVTVSAVPSVDDIVKGENDYLFETTVTSSEMYKVKFGAPDESNSGTIDIWNKYDKNKKQSGTYTYANGQFTITTTSNTLGLADGAEFEISMTSYYKLKLVSATEETYSLQAPTSDITDAELAVIKGKYEAVEGTKTTTIKFTQSSTVKGDGNITVSVVDSSDSTASKSATYKYTFNCDTKACDVTLTSGDDCLSYALTVSQDKLMYGTIECVSKTPNLKEICQGTYTASFDNSGNGNYTYTIVFNEDGTATLTNSGKNRTRVCSYAYNDETGQLKFTKISGSSSSVGIESAIYIVDDKLKYTSPTMGGDPVFSREGDSDTTSSIPSSIQGTYYANYSDSDYVFTISSDKVTVVNEEGESYASYTLASYLNGVVTVTDDSFHTNATIAVADGVVTFTDSNFYTGTLSTTAPVYTAPSTMVGTWEGKTSNGYDEFIVTIESGKTTISVSQNDDLSTYTIIKSTNTIIKGTATIYGQKSTIVLTINSDGTISMNMDDNTFEATLSQAATITFSEDYQGLWTNSADSKYFIISDDSITYCSMEVSSLRYDEDDKYYTFSLTSGSYVLYLENGSLVMKEETSLDEISFSKKFDGEYTNSDDSKSVIISGLTVTYNSNAYTIISYSQGQVEASDEDDISIKFTAEGKLSVANVAASVEFDKVLTYSGMFDDELSEVIKIYNTKVTWSEDDADANEYTIQSKTDGTIVAKDENNFYLKLVPISTGYRVYTGSDVTSDEDYGELTDVSLNVTTSTEVSFTSKYIGTWVDSTNNVTVVITADSITVNGVTKEFSYDETDGYIVKIENSSGTLCDAYVEINADGDLTIESRADGINYTCVKQNNVD